MKKSHSVRTIILAGSLLLQLSTLCFHSRGAAGDVDLSFDPGSGVNGPVDAVVVQPDGKVIIAGLFTTVKGLLRTNIARLNADGSGDATFNPVRAYNPVYALALQSDGKVLASGQFLETCDDWGCYYPTAVVRLNADGSRDTSFVPANSEGVVALAVQPDGKVLVGHDYGIARLNSDGSQDSSFNQGGGANGNVFSVALQPDGKVLIGGLFSTFGGTNRNGIARLNANGSLDASFDPGTELKFFDEYPYPRVESIVVQSDGKVLVAGYFTNLNGNSIARFNSNGSLDSSFNSGTGANGVVSSVVLQSGGKVLLGGYFSVINGASRNRIARLNADGSLDSSFNPGIDAGVDSIIVQSDGKLFINGLFTTVNGTKRNRMARLNADGSLDGCFDPGAGVESPVFSIAVQPDGRVLVGNELMTGGIFAQRVGVFTFVNGTNRYVSARLNADGSLDNAFIRSTLFSPNLAVVDQYDDCLGGNYSCVKAIVPAAVLVQADGKVLIGGHVQTTVSGDEVFFQSTRYFLARFNATGSLDTSFEPAIENPSQTGHIDALAVQPDGKVIVGGTFYSIKGTNRIGIARLNADGTLDTGFNPGTGANWASSIALQPDGKVLIGGWFTAVNGTNRSGIARLNANGSLDGSFNPGTGVSGSSVSSIALQPDGKVLIGGSFTTVNGTNRNHIARLNARARRQKA